MTQRAINLHEAFANNLAFENQILWDAYSPEQFNVFQDKLKQLFRSPNPNDPRSNKNMEKVRDVVYKSTISQTKYTNKNLLATFVLVTVANCNTHLEAQEATQFSLHLLIRTRKCIKNNDSTNCCMVFIDEHGRVYQNWKCFINNNLLPEGRAFAPFNGVYEFRNERLVMDSWATPASDLASQIVNATDNVAGVGGFAAAGITLSALMFPISAPVLAGAGAVCLGTGIYSAVRSGWHLWTRNEREQSISLSDASARNCWLGVASGATAVGSTVANRTIAQLALAGREVSLVQQTVVNGMNISTMLLSGTGIGNGILDLILRHVDDEEISNLEILQVAASLVIFTHSVYNFRLASTIVRQAQDSTVNAHRTELSNRQRKMFDKMAKETIRTQGATNGKRDLVRFINEVPDKQYLNDLHKVNKDLNKMNIRFRAGADVTVVLNDDVSIKPNVLRSNIQHSNGDILGKVTKPIPQSHTTIPDQSTVNLLTSNAFSENSTNLLYYCQSAFDLASKLILNPENFQNCVQHLIVQVGREITQYLIRKAKEFLERYRDIVENFVRSRMHIETVLWDLYKKCEANLVTISLETLEEKVTEMFDLLLQYYETLSCTNSLAERIKCTTCGGIYEICTID